MKSISALFLALTLGASAFAQEETITTKTKTTTTTTTSTENTDNGTCYSFKSKNGHEVLPQKGDWAIGISATSFLNFLGGMFNNNATVVVPTFTAANSPTAFAVGNLSGGSLLLKYMAKPDMAYRLRFQLNGGGVTYRNLVLKNTLTPDPLSPQYVTDEQTINSYIVTLCPGFEFRRGSSRFQGVFGGELLLGLSGSNTKYTYGNAFTADFNAPTSTTDFGTGATASVSSRPKESKTGTQFLGGVRVFGGVEFFVAPKMSLGGEIGYTLGFSTNGEGSTTTESWYSPTQSVASVTTKGYSNLGLRSWGLGVDNVNAGINFNFYF